MELKEHLSLSVHLPIPDSQPWQLLLQITRYLDPPAQSMAPDQQHQCLSLRMTDLDFTTQKDLLHVSLEIYYKFAHAQGMSANKLYYSNSILPKTSLLKLPPNVPYPIYFHSPHYIGDSELAFLPP